MQDMDDKALLEEALAPEQPEAPATDEAVLADEPAEEQKPPRDEHGRFLAKGEEPAAEEEQPKEQERVVHTVPLNELLAIRERAQQAERERDEYRRRVEERDIRERQAEQARQQQMPDMITQPREYHAWVMAQFEAKLSQEREAARAGIVDISMRMQHRQHGQEFEKAYQALVGEISRGNLELRKSITMSPDPGEALMSWWAEVTTRHEIGSDLSGFKQRYRQQLMQDAGFRKEMADFIRGQGQSRGQPVQQARRSSTRSLPSLNRSTGAADLSDGGEDFDEAGLLKNALRR